MYNSEALRKQLLTDRQTQYRGEAKRAHPSTSTTNQRRAPMRWKRHRTGQ